MTDHNEGNQSNGDNDNNSDGDEEELVIERIGEPRTGRTTAPSNRNSPVHTGCK